MVSPDQAGAAISVVTAVLPVSESNPATLLKYCMNLNQIWARKPLGVAYFAVVPV